MHTRLTEGEAVGRNGRHDLPVADHRYGTLAVDTLLKVLAGETIPARTPIDSPVITPANMADFQPAY